MIKIELGGNMWFEAVKIKDAVEPIDGLSENFKDRWWIVTDQDEILFYHGVSAQCNADKLIAERIIKNGIYKGLNVRIQRIPVVYRRLDMRDWCE